MFSLIIFLSSCVGVQNNQNGGGSTSPILTMYATLKDSDVNTILVSPGDEFNFDISAMNLGNNTQFTIKLLFEEGLQTPDDIEFDITIPYMREKVFLRSVKFRALEEGYHKIEIRAFGDDYFGAGSFWVCVASNSDDKEEVCGLSDPQVGPSKFRRE